MSGALIEEPFVSVTPTLVATFGPVCAIVLQQVHYVSLIDYKGGERGECAEIQERIAIDTGLSEDQVQKALARLVSIGAVRSEPDPKDRRRRKYSVVREAIPPAGYRPARSPQIGGDRESPPNGGEISANRRRSPGGTSTRRTKEEKPSPTPPKGGADVGGGGRLFEEPKAEPDRKAKKAATKRGKVPEIVAARYDLWVARYPPGPQRGDRQAGLRAFAKALDGGESTADLEAELEHYVAARRAYHAAWEHVGDYWPAIMRVATFLNGKRRLWERPWTFEDLEYWPPPAGRSWAQAKREGAPAAESIVERRKRMVAEEAAAERAAAKAEAESRGVA